MLIFLVNSFCLQSKDTSWVSVIQQAELMDYGTIQIAGIKIILITGFREQEANLKEIIGTK